MKSEFEHCIRCTICVENCPVFKVNKDYPGPKQAGPDSQRFRLDGEASVDDWVKLCTQCKRCEVACPYGVDPAEIILKAQLKYGKEHLRPPTAHLFANNFYLGTLGSLAAPIANRVTKWGFVQKIFNLMGISTYMPFPSFNFRSMNKSWRWKGRGQRKVVFFHGCFLNFNQPGVGRNIVALLASMGLKVVVPQQTCCGLPALGNGDLDTAKRYAAKNARILAEYIDKGYDVIYSCTSCGQTIMHDYPGIMELPEGRKVSENCYNVHEYILNLIEDGYVTPNFGPVNKTIAYHIPCHLRAAGIGYPAAKLLKMVPGLKLHVMDDNCCGLSGSYGFKTRNAETAQKLGQLAADAVLSVNPDELISDCGACRMQVGNFAKIPAVDPTEILLESLLTAQGAGRKLKRLK